MPTYGLHVANNGVPELISMAQRAEAAGVPTLWWHMAMRPLRSAEVPVRRTRPSHPYRLDASLAPIHPDGVQTSSSIGDPPELREVVERIVAALSPIEVILFGSQARQEASPDSDIDIAIVMPEGTRRLDAAKAAYRSIRGVPGRTRGVDIVVVSPGELERGRDDIGTLTPELLRDGRSLYREASLAGG